MEWNAVVFKDRNQVVFESVNCPDPGPDQVVVNVTQSWISNGTEGSYLRGERIEGDTPWRPGDPHPFPVIAGYQKAGTVDWVGSEVSNLSKGDSVFVSVSAVTGMFEPRGGHISPSVSGAGAVIKLPPGLDPVAYSGLVLTQVDSIAVTDQIGAGGSRRGCGRRSRRAVGRSMLASRGANTLLIGRHADRLAKFKNGETLLEDSGAWVDAVRERFPEGAQVGVTP